MIRIKKDRDIPDSLQKENCTTYAEDDVLRQLNEDQYGKCYICEKKVNNDFEVDHFKPKTSYSDLKYEWTNLMQACPYCNRRKSSLYDKILNPIENDIESIISHKIDSSNNKIVLSSARTDDETNNTINLIERLFNGKYSLRGFKEEKLYEMLIISYNFFIRQIIKYKSSPSEENKQIIIDLLKVEKEFLAFKYQVIINNSSLLATFSPYIIWNKAAS